MTPTTASQNNVVYSVPFAPEAGIGTTLPPPGAMLHATYVGSEADCYYHPNVGVHGAGAGVGASGTTTLHLQACPPARSSSGRGAHVPIRRPVPTKAAVDVGGGSSSSSSSSATIVYAVPMEEDVGRVGGGGGGDDNIIYAVPTADAGDRARNNTYDKWSNASAAAEAVASAAAAERRLMAQLPESEL